MYPQQYPQGSNIPLLPNQRTYSLPQNKQPATYIDLTKKQKVGVSNLVSHQEKIYFAGVVSKVNKRGLAQNRIIVITNKFFYNIDPEGGVFSFLCSPSGSYSLQRKIAIQKIFGATVSVNPTSELQQFVIHVQGEYDYRFNGGQKREKFLRSLMNAHFANSSQPFVLYCQNEANLFRFHTTDDDFYAKVNKRPKQGQILVTPDMAENGIEWIIFNRYNFAGRPNTARPVPSSTNQPQLPGPLYLPPSNNFHGAFAQNPGYPLMPHVPQWGNPMPYGYPGPTNERPSYYVPEAQPQFSTPPVNMNINQQYTQNQIPVQPKEVRQVNKENNEVMTMQAKRQSSGPNDWSFIQRNIVPYNSSPNANVQIHTNFDYVYQNGQQNGTLNNYNGYNNVQNPNFRPPNM